MESPNISIKNYSRHIAAVRSNFLSKTSWVVKLSEIKNLSLQPPKLGKNLAGNLSSIYYASTPEVVSQRSIKPLHLGRSPRQYIAVYQKTFVLPSECSGKRNKLNIKAFQSKKYQITRNLFVVVKQNVQTEQQVGVAYANLLLSKQGQELIA